jgi:RNA polymerase sigma-B factor
VLTVARVTRAVRTCAGSAYAEQGRTMALVASQPYPALRRRGDEHNLFVRYRRDRDPALRNALVERFMPLARHLARRYPAGAERDDLLQVASLGLVKAVERFDPARGAAFASFATPTILGEIKRYFRDYGWTVRVPRELQDRSLRVADAGERLTTELGRAPTVTELADALGTPVDSVLEALASDSAHHPIPLDRGLGDGEADAAGVLAAADDRGYSDIEDVATVDSLLDRLPGHERDVVRLRFREDLLQREIADRVGVSQMHVSRLLAKAIADLRDLAEAG